MSSDKGTNFQSLKLVVRGIQMKIDEFTDTYSDDLIHLQEARTALLTHPLRNENSDLCNASFCRIYSIMMIGSIEAMLERWCERDNFNILNEYFAPGIPNENRIKNLREVFVEKGINVQAKVFEDYLAIKYIRNAIVHASWKTAKGKLKQDQLDWINERGFPTDTRKLTSKDLERFEWVNENMMFYIALTGLDGVRARPDLVDIAISPSQLHDTNGIINQSDWPKMYWSNIERISSEINKMIESAANRPGLGWACDFTEVQLEKMPNDKLEKQFYLSALSAKKDNFDGLVDKNNLADNALMCWEQFVSQTPVFETFNEKTVKLALKTLRVMLQNNIHPKDHILPPLSKDAPFEIKEKLFSMCFEHLGSLTILEIIEAYDLGEKAKFAIGNITPLNLFAIQLPILAPERNDEWRQKAQYIADIFEIGQSWYSSIEGYSSPQSTIEFYREMSALLTKDS
ncbi:hypothetical protein BIW53_12005 [Pseudoalteromonas byunsanensis]|uniref:Uncharacterized protein n=2 Tax=Pseudoalteromonas byunsanensis TaxID=327939 RepID=A0A1S1N5W2_9GAMM|nr:hypothetical protein BIW53_12005 [Pseudoalteromonas byunsanensis]